MKRIREDHPTGLTGVCAAALVVIAKKLGVDLSVEEAAIIWGAVVGVASKFTPRSVPSRNAAVCESGTSHLR